MKSTTFAMAILFFTMLSFGAIAQKKPKPSKQEKKELSQLKTQMKKMDPADFKKMLTDNKAMKTETASCNDRIGTMQSELASKDSELNQAKSAAEDYRNKYEALAAENAAESNEVIATRMSSKGVVFKVQIGAFKNKNLTKYFENNSNFSGEVDNDGTKKYTLGYFRDYWEADNFKKYLREMGVKDAWIVPYKDGQRVNIKDVLEQQQLNKPTKS